ncbi:MAG: glycosyltransferase family 4 protein [Bacteroidota bacterium]|nr:glycosyltransferase family 4 protein [Bacteroidota bacterium]
MSFTVLNVAYPLAPVKDDTAGGAEHVLSMIDSALVKAGHKSLVIASEGSSPSGILLPTPAYTGKINSSVEKSAHLSHKSAIDRALDNWNIDLVHMHGIDFDSYIPDPGIPVLVTLHLPIQWYNERSFSLKRPDTYLNCVSRSQMQSAPAIKNMVPYIENGIVINDYTIDKNNKGDFALSLGRVCEEKGYHCALDAAKIANIKLIIAGELFPYEYHQQFFYHEILPRLDNDKYKFIGPVGKEKKKDLLSKARCLLVPSLVPETSSLVAMEALASGTPVIAYPQGALKEIIENNKTGFLVNSIDEMAQAINKIDEIDPDLCRKTAENRFSADIMIKKYFDLYDKIIKKTIHLPQQVLRRLPYE